MIDKVAPAIQAIFVYIPKGKGREISRSCVTSELKIAKVAHKAILLRKTERGEFRARNLFTSAVACWNCWLWLHHLKKGALKEIRSIWHV